MLRRLLHSRFPAATPTIVAWGTISACMLLHCAASPRVGPNVILISIDTLRADRLGAYGYERDTSPALDALAAEGVVFEHVVAESPWTLPSHVTMLSGVHPDGHGVTVPDLRSHPDLPSLPSRLRELGYLTLGFTDGGYVGAQYGFDRGFAVFDESPDGLDAALEEAMPLVESAGDRPFFLFLHTYDVHCPYDPAPEYVSRFATDDARPFDTSGKCGNPQYNQMVFKPGQLEHVSNVYDAGIRELDDELGAFFARLDALGLRDDTLILVTSDHGEEFKEHGQIGHERSLYREVLMIPLIVAGPGIAPGRSGAPAALVDIVPTITAFLGGNAKSIGDGRALLERDEATRWRPVRDDERVLTSTLSWKLPLRSTMDTRRHRIRNSRVERDELYDMRDDPREARNLLDEGPVDTPQLMPGLVAGQPDTIRRFAPLPIEAITPEQAERLRTLGYLQ